MVLVVVVVVLVVVVLVVEVVVAVSVVEVIIVKATRNPTGPVICQGSTCRIMWYIGVARGA